MNPGYETVVDFSTVVWTLSAMLIHAVMVIIQVGLIVFLIASGLLAWLAPEVDGRWLWRLDTVRVSVSVCEDGPRW